MSSYKANNTYISVLSDDESQTLAIVLSRSPVNWSMIEDSEYSGYRQMRRLELGVDRLFVKYLLPEQLIKISGPSAGIAIPVSRIEIEDRLEDRGYYIIKTGTRYIARVITRVKRIINMKPQKKYEILEKCIADEQD